MTTEFQSTPLPWSDDKIRDMAALYIALDTKTKKEYIATLRDGCSKMSVFKAGAQLTIIACNCMDAILDKHPDDVMSIGRLMVHLLRLNNWVYTTLMNGKADPKQVPRFEDTADHFFFTV